MSDIDRSVTDSLSAFVAGADGARIPKAALDNAKLILLDTIACALAASRSHVGHIITDYVTEMAPTPAAATVIGGGRKVTAPMAALANGTLANALDFDEGFHVATHVVPAALATAEAHGLSGRAVAEALVVGYEAGSRLTEMLDGKRSQKQGPTYRGWWHVGLVGPLAAAVTASRLLRLDAQQIALTLGVASSSSGGFRRSMGTMTKGLHSGNAALAGLQAALLVRRGFTGDTNIIQAPRGFLSAACQEGEADPAAVTQRLGRPFVLEGPAPIKTYPACTPIHPALDAALALLRGHAFSFEDIERVEADLQTFSLFRSEPLDEDAAGFNGAYALAAAFVHRAFGLPQITQEAVQDRRVLALMRRIRHVEGASRLTVALKDGRSLDSAVEPLSRLRRLTTAAEVREKFHVCRAGVLEDAAADFLADAVLALEQQPDIGALMAAAAGRGAR